VIREDGDRAREDGTAPSCGLAALMLNSTTRRRFLGAAGLGGAGVYVIGKAMEAMPAFAQETVAPTVQRQLYQMDAEGMVIGDPTKCVGCGRCELACTEFNEGRSQPVMARVKIQRNYSFGTEHNILGYQREEGIWGNHIVVQETCKQCPHPVPCATACPYAAIEVDGPANARVVNQDKCVGCRICQQACPWDMTCFDEELGKATKCHLCGGDPECVQACVSGALSYVPWEDLTRVTPESHVVPAYIGIPVGVQEACAKCH